MGRIVRSLTALLAVSTMSLCPQDPPVRSNTFDIYAGLTMLRSPYYQSIKNTSEDLLTMKVTPIRKGEVVPDLTTKCYIPAHTQSQVSGCLHPDIQRAESQIATIDYLMFEFELHSGDEIKRFGYAPKAKIDVMLQYCVDSVKTELERLSDTDTKLHNASAIGLSLDLRHQCLDYALPWREIKVRLPDAPVNKS